MKSVGNRIISGRFLVPVKTSSSFSILAIISSYKFPFRCSFTHWICIDKGYNTIVLDIHYLVMENLIFSTLEWPSPSAFNSSMLPPLGSFLRDLSIKIYNTYTYQR
jgi:hypothetical protein